ncbi:RagB/SusD family nutrient uptake outer membrane protein [Pseudoflavitalea rhizosphaerae]|uniref:RagB/SusD family nutrient uptake outer membrane protein n=1 Tax=Pseudoflavitalea rhizosphaerae TaxID=1884793 RepID=UPI000F8CAAAB|nr:RagB/SusD family nutrient uptake outer membrane protein [Pseudoflavitalea rhizosphaerae]
MKYAKYISIQLLLFCLVFAGCDKYLDVTPKGKRLLTTTADYDLWLNDESVIYGLSPVNNLLNFLGDNVDMVNIALPPVKEHELIYTWASQFSTDLNASPAFWGEHYSKINHFNTVLVGIDDATGGTIVQKRTLKAEALLGRALEYFHLVNEYGKLYDSTTASQDLAVPFVTSNDVTQIVPARITVAEMHKQIIDDLNAAIPDLPADNSANRFRGSKAAAYSVLARVYFYAGNYTDAQKNAALALQYSNAVMINFNGTIPASNLISVHPDVIYGRMVIGSSIPTLDFLRSFAGNDLRVRKLYYSRDGYSFTERGATQFFPAYVTPSFTYANSGTSVQEMKLIIAECAARSNDLTTALQQLDEVRMNRFAAASYVPFQSGNQEEVLNEVLKERSHELPFTGLRWLDMRRLNKENRMGTVNRYDAQGNIITSLEPHSDRYTLQIPVQVLTYNPGMKQNP